ncbi:MAG TPA: AsmA family protein [Verrucomicrobiae bacterium]|jgi:hypothetical protein|nr:AsmA family protein [Verrucomicrobiae bacterium]
MMMARVLLSRKKTFLALVLMLAAAVFLPPNINGTRFRDRLAPALSAALGREVKIGQISFHLFPRPGFNLYAFRVMDDPAFSAEPLLSCGEVKANLRLTSLWQGRLEIADLKLENNDASPPSLNLVYANGHWNLESLLLRAGQVPSAPTSKKTAEQRPRFPYIEASAARINLKIGPAKKPYALVNTDFAFWLASEDQWHFRLEGRPTRTDMDLNDTGAIKLEGDLKRSQDLHDLPVKIQFEWQRAQLGQISSLLAGYDQGWRGGLDLSVQLSGSLSDLRLSAAADLQHLRRYDIKRDDLPRFTPHCQAQYAKAILSWDCDALVDRGTVRFMGRILPEHPREYDGSLSIQHVPLALLAILARNTQQTLPDDLSVTGELTANFACHFKEGQPAEWHGNAAATSFVLQSSGAKPFVISAVRLRFAPAEQTQPISTKTTISRKPSIKAEPTLLTIAPFSIQLGKSTALQGQGEMDRNGYRLQIMGPAPLDRILELGRSFGFPSRISNATGDVTLDLTVHGDWTSFKPPRLGGSAHLENVTGMVPGLNAPLRLAAADVQFTDAALVLDHLAGQFGNSPIVFTGSTSHAWICAGEISCPFEFDLHADSLRVADAAALMGQTSRWSLPFFPGSSKPLPDFRASGTVSIDSLKVGEFTAQNVAAHVQLGDKALLINNVTASIAGGTASADWRADWHVTPAKYTCTGTFNGVAIEHLGPGPQAALLASWITGKAAVTYSLQYAGNNGAEMLSSAGGKVQFNVANGTSRALLFEPARPVKFHALQGTLELDHGVLKVLPSKLKAESRIYDISGTVSLADRQTNLTAGSSVVEWDITGTLEKPHIAAHVPAVEAASAH